MDLQFCIYFLPPIFLPVIYVSVVLASIFGSNTLEGCILQWAKVKPNGLDEQLSSADYHGRIPCEVRY